MHNKRKNGFSLIITIILIAFLAIAAVALVALWQSSVMQNVQQEKSMQAYYLAKSGALAMASWIIDNPSTALLNSIENVESSPAKLKGSAGTIRIKVTRTSTMITVTSTGTVSGAKETLKVDIVRGFAFNKAVIAKDLSNGITGNISINGGVEYQSTDDLKITGSATISGGVVSEGDINLQGNKVYVDSTTSYVPHSLMTPIPVPNLSLFKRGSTLTINGVTTTINSTITNDSSIAADLQIGKNDINGSWLLAKCLVQGTTQMILLSDSSTASIKLSGNPNYDLSIYAPLASIWLNGNFQMNGSVIGDEVTMNGGGNPTETNVSVNSLYTVITGEFFKSYVILPGSWGYPR